MANYKYITLFLTNGEKLRFEKVTDFDAYYGDGLATFKYVSAIDGEKNAATLLLNNVVMVAGVKE